MLTNLCLDGELDVIHAPPVRSSISAAVPHISFGSTFILALQRTAADAPGAEGGELRRTNPPDAGRYVGRVVSVGPVTDWPASREERTTIR
jgi:hypothetical protein